MSRERFFIEIASSLTDYVRQRKPGFFEIAVFTSLSGAWAKGGWVTKRGYDTWSEWINAKGGIKVGSKKYPVRLIYYDTHSDVSYARTLVEEVLSTEKFDFIFGPCSSDETLAIAPVIERFKIPHITGSAESAEITEKGFEWTFGVLLSNPPSFKSPLKLLKRELNLGAATAAILSADDSFSRFTAKSFLNAVDKLNLKLQCHITFPPHQEDFTSSIHKIEKYDPDILIVSGHISNLIDITRAVKSLSHLPRAYVMHYGVATQDFVDALGHDAAGILGLTQWSPEINYQGPVFGSAQNFQRIFVSRYDRQPDDTEVGCATAGVIFQQSIEQLGLEPPLKQEDKYMLRDTLWNVEFETFFGPIHFFPELIT